MSYRIDVEYRVCILHDACDTLKAHSCIDVRMSKIAVAAVLFSGELCENMVPEFQVSVTVAARLAVRLSAAEFRTSVIVDLRAWSAWAESDLPEIVFFTEPYDPLLRKSDFLPDLYGFIIVLVDCCPELILRHLQDFGDELPAPVKGLSLEVIAKGEVSKHLEECTVPCSYADIFYIAGPDAFLACRHSLFRRSFKSGKIRLKRRHSGVDDKYRLIVLRDKRRTLSAVVIFALLVEA